MTRHSVPLTMRLLLPAALAALGSPGLANQASVPVGAQGLALFQTHCVAPLVDAKIPHVDGLAPLDAEKTAQFKRILGLMGVDDADPEGQEFWVTDSSKLIYVTRQNQPYCVVFGFDAEYLEVQAALAAWQGDHGAAFVVDGDFALDDGASGRPALASATKTTVSGETVRLSLSYDPKLAGLFVAAGDRIDQ